MFEIGVGVFGVGILVQLFPSLEVGEELRQLSEGVLNTLLQSVILLANHPPHTTHIRIGINVIYTRSRIFPLLGPVTDVICIILEVTLIIIQIIPLPLFIQFYYHLQQELHDGRDEFEDTLGLVGFEEDGGDA